MVKLFDVNNHTERFPVPRKTIYHLFYVMANELLESYKLRLLLLSDGTLIDDNEHLGSLENAKELIAYAEEQMSKLSIYFDTRTYVQSKSISYSLNIDYFI